MLEANLKYESAMVSLLILFNQLKLMSNMVQAILISGGFMDGYKNIEMHSMKNTESCQLPGLPNDRHRHTQDGRTICGGGSYGRFRTRTRSTCITLNEEGEWKISHRLIEPRASHVSWKMPEGILLMGGENSPNTTELIKDDGTVQEYFPLKYNSM